MAVTETDLQSNLAAAVRIEKAQSLPGTLMGVTQLSITKERNDGYQKKKHLPYEHVMLVDISVREV